MAIENLAADSSPSSLRAETARRNGAKSRGPKTQEGKRRSSQNSVTHGMYSQSIVLPGESQEEYDHLRDEYLVEFSPAGPVERHQVETLIDAEWRIRRLRKMETATVADKMADRQQLPIDLRIAYSYSSDVNMSSGVKSVYQFEPRLQRDYDRALRRLLDLQKRRQKAQNEPNTDNDPDGQLVGCGARTPSCRVATPGEASVSPGDAGVTDIGLPDYKPVSVSSREAAVIHLDRPFLTGSSDLPGSS